MGIMEKKMETTYNGLGSRIYGVYGDLIIIYPKPNSIYLRGTINLDPLGKIRSIWPPPYPLAVGDRQGQTIPEEQAANKWDFPGSGFRV